MFLIRDFTISTIRILSGMACTSLELLHEQWNPPFCLLCLQLCKKLLEHIAFDMLIATNQRVVADLAATTRGGCCYDKRLCSVLFICSMKA